MWKNWIISLFQEHGVQRRMISVVNFFRIFEIITFCFAVAIRCSPVTLRILDLLIRPNCKIKHKLDLMFMKHYAPNRCLYIKVAKLRTGEGSTETSYLQNCSVKLFKEHFKVQICKGRLFEKKTKNFFSNFHQLISSSSSISWPSLKPLAVIVFEISWIQIFKVKICKGR